MALKVPSNPSLEGLAIYQPGRPIEEVAREFGLDPSSLIKVASNENPLGPSPLALKAMQEEAAEMHLYPDGNSFHLKKSLCHHLGIQPSNLILGNGSNEIIEFLGHAFLGPGTNIVVSQFGFAIYTIVARMMGADVITVPAKDFGHDLKAMREAINEQTRVLFVANPNNPTGTLASRAEVVDLINHMPEHCVLVMDEAYFEFLADPVDLIPMIREEQMQNLLVMRTFSKIYGLAGLRIGYGIGCPQLIGLLEKSRQPFNVNAMAQAGALAALEDIDHLNATRKTNAEGLKFLEQGFIRLGLQYVPSHANFILVKVGDGAGVFQKMQRNGVIVRPMQGYGLPEWIRLSVGTAEENNKSLIALEKALRS
jgi:histidinol-phosphate aminotransferase